MVLRKLKKKKILSENENPQNISDPVSRWMNKWRIKFCEIHVNYAMEKKIGSIVFTSITSKYRSRRIQLNIYLDGRSTWKQHVRRRAKQILLKAPQMC